MTVKVVFTVPPDDKPKLEMTVSELSGRATDIASLINDSLRVRKSVFISFGEFQKLIDFEFWDKTKTRLRNSNDCPETSYVLELQRLLKSMEEKC